MSSCKSVTIAGGGLAGLTLGIALRRRGVPVTVWEAGGYPRHRACGEFISGRGQEVLARLGLVDSLRQAGAIPATTASFYLGQAASPVRLLPAPALCLSRLTLDTLLAQRFRAAGGELRENSRWHEEQFEEGVVRATGRRLQLRENGRQWFGLKIHARNVPLASDLEVHGADSGYVGLCRLANGEVNVCGLFQPPLPARDSSQPWLARLRGREGSPLWRRLEHATFDQGSFCSVAGISLRPHRAVSRTECCIGDSLTMIPPVTGNGMSMAFEAAELAVGPLASYSQGDISWGEARQNVAMACDLAFACRLTWARWLQWLMSAPLLRGSPGSIALQSEFLWRLLFARTR